jgi:hypothetical protein
VGITTLLTLVAFYSYYPFSGAARQRRNMAITEKLLPTLLPLIKADKRFSHVDAQVFTGYDGSIMMTGAVRSDEELAHLKQIVDSASPPVEVIWQVLVLPPDQFDEILDK